MRRMDQSLMTYLPLLLVIAVIGWRMSRSMRGRPINPSYLWVRPAVLAVILVPMMMVSLRTDPVALASLAAALVLGAGAGYMLSRHQQLSLVGGKIISKTSPIGVILFVLLYGARYVFWNAMESGQAPGKLAAHSTQIFFYSNLAIVFLFALVCAQAWEIRRRCRPLVAEKAALAAKTAAEPAAD
jgi:hypothetical protein